MVPDRRWLVGSRGPSDQKVVNPTDPSFETTRHLASGSDRLSPEIFRAAKLQIERDGYEASMRAARRADELADGGDMYGGAIWRQI
jgi:hypothetical protein